MAVPDEQHFAVTAYLALDRASPHTRYEFLDGQITALAGGGLDNTLIASSLIQMCAERFGKGPCRTFGSDARVRISSRRYVYPDVTISCDPRDRGKQDTIRSPRVVFEVLSPSTEAYDRGKKADAYRACPTIEAIVFVATDQRGVEVQSRSGDGWSLRSYGPGASAVVPGLELALPVNDVYRWVAIEESDDENDEED